MHALMVSKTFFHPRRMLSLRLILTAVATVLTSAYHGSGGDKRTASFQSGLTKSRARHKSTWK